MVLALGFLRFAVCGFRFAVCGFRFEVCGFRFEVVGFRLDDGTLMGEELSKLATIIDASKQGRNVRLGGVPVTPEYREALQV